MLAMIDGAGTSGNPANEAHPLYWAPFVVVGEGGTGR
jgi:CHAT domain-containing protein